MKLKLSNADIHELLEYPSEEVRIEIAQGVAEQIATQGLSKSELVIAQEIVMLLAEDAAERVREVLATILSSSPDIPRNAALSLAKDIERIAVPVLQQSPILTDNDLISFVRDGTGAKQLAIAQRAHVSEDVSDALVTAGSSTVVAALAANAGARISEPTCLRVIDRFADEESVTTSLARRTDLPLTVVEELVGVVSDHIRQELMTRHDVDPQIIRRLTHQGFEQTLAELAGETTDPKEIKRLVDKLHSENRITGSLILRAAFLGNFRFVEEALGRLAGLDHAKTWVLMHDRGPLGLRALFEQTGLPDTLYPALRTAVDVYQQMDYDGGPNDKERFRNRMMERVLTQYDNINAKDLNFFLSKLERIAADGERGAAEPALSRRPGDTRVA